MSEFKNILTFGIKTESVEHKNVRMDVFFFERGEVTFTVPGVLQLIHGAQLHLNEVERDRSKFHELDLYFKLASLIIDKTPHIEEAITLTLYYRDLVILKKLLEVRMQHCELERDQRSDKFNPDTYIAQKVLLLDLKLLLTGEVYQQELREK